MKKAYKILIGLLMAAAEAAVLIYSGPDSAKMGTYAKAAWTSVVDSVRAFTESVGGPESEGGEETSASKPDESEGPQESQPDESGSEESRSGESAPDRESQSEDSVPETIEIEESVFTLDERFIIHLAASSTEEDMYLVVRDAQGRNAQGSFRITVTGPDGSRTTVETNDHGSTYLRQLKPGLYTLSCEPKEGFTQAEDFSIRVKEKVEKKVIQNIEDVVDIKVNNEENEKELQGDKDDKGNQSQGETPEINGEPSQPEVESKEESREESLPFQPGVSPEPNGSRQDLSDGVCTFSIGPEGYLLLRGSNVESDVLPVMIDGLLAYGKRLSSSEEADPAYEQVELFTGSHTPAADYEINLIPEEESSAPEKPENGWYEQSGRQYYYQNGAPVTGYVKIDGKHYYFNESGVKAAAMGIDVSEWQRVSDWSKVKADGIDFIIIRIGGRGYGPSGTLYSDDRAIGYIRDAQAAGLKVGIYFFSAAITSQEAVEEASWTIRTLQTNNIHPDMPIYIDMEHSAEYPNGRADQLNREQHTLVAKAFCETVTNAGYEAGIYASKSYFLSELSYTQLDSYSIWLANWTTNYTMPSFSYHYDLWQFSSSATVSGISGRVDIDVIF